MRLLKPEKRQDYLNRLPRAGPFLPGLVLLAGLPVKLIITPKKRAGRLGFNAGF